MPKEFSPRMMQKQVEFGRDRLSNFRKGRVMFLRAYLGQYYDSVSGTIGSEALGFVFNAAKALIPHIVMSFPKHNVKSKWMNAKEQADNYALALAAQDRELDIMTLYRRWVTDSLFAPGIMKTGLSTSDSLVAINEYDQIDNGETYSAIVDFDNFIADPRSKEHHFADAAWLGDTICVPRMTLLDSGLYKNDLIEKLPSVGQENKERRARDFSMRSIHENDIEEDEDYVEITELWVPGANALVTVPGGEDVAFDDYLRVADYFGPKTGPYTLLSLNLPVPGNPLPVASVGVWYDLHVLANRMAKKIIEQAERQKDVVAYERRAADDASELRDAGDGETIAVDDTDAIKTLSFGGQQNSNESHLASLSQWFSMMSSNPEQLAGSASDASSATAASILNTNSNVGLNDARDMVYQAAAREARNRAWFTHTDPLRNIPLLRRRLQPAQYLPGPMGPIIVSQPRMVEEQIILTPEMRRGDFLDFTFEIEPMSMGRADPQQQFAKFLDFCTKLLPAILTACQTAMAMGLALSPKAMLMRAAQMAGVDWLDEVFYDPEFQMMMAQMQAMGPQQANSQPQPGGGPGLANGGGNVASPAALMQNGQPANIPFNPSPEQQANAQPQQGANLMQSVLASQGV